jgi:hypothetical protein
MKNYEFVVWLEGYLDLCPADRFDVAKLRIVRNHLNLVKAVEGELGPLNTEIFRYISDLIDKGNPVPLEAGQVLSTRIQAFLAERFPGSVSDPLDLAAGEAALR